MQQKAECVIDLQAPFFQGSITSKFLMMSGDSEYKWPKYLPWMSSSSSPSMVLVWFVDVVVLLTNCLFSGHWNNCKSWKFSKCLHNIFSKILLSFSKQKKKKKGISSTCCIVGKRRRQNRSIETLVMISQCKIDHGIQITFLHISIFLLFLRKNYPTPFHF